MNVSYTLQRSADRSSLQDVDDDVRTVAADALSPITSQIATQLPYDKLSEVIDTLWDSLGEGEDELGSSTGAVMDLLCEFSSSHKAELKKYRRHDYSSTSDHDHE